MVSSSLISPYKSLFYEILEQHCQILVQNLPDISSTPEATDDDTALELRRLQGKLLKQAKQLAQEYDLIQQGIVYENADDEAV